MKFYISIKDNNGIDTEASYPYKAADQACAFNPANVGATDSGFTDVAHKDENALLKAVGTGNKFWRDFIMVKFI